MNTNDKLKAIHATRNKDIICDYSQLETGEWLLSIPSSYFQDLRLNLNGVLEPRFYRTEDIIVKDAMMMMIHHVCPRVGKFSVQMRESAVDTILLSVLSELEDNSYRELEILSSFQLFSRIELCANRRRLESLFTT